MSTVQTTIRSISPTREINHHIDKHFNKLKRTYNKINQCRVVIDLSKNNTNKDKMFSVRINLTIPGKELSTKKQNSNLFIALRDGFSAVEQLLEKHHKKKWLSNKNYSYYLRDYENDSWERAS